MTVIIKRERVHATNTCEKYEKQFDLPQICN